MRRWRSPTGRCSGCVCARRGVELRYPDDDDVVAVAALAAEGDARPRHHAVPRAVDPSRVAGLGTGGRPVPVVAARRGVTRVVVDCRSWCAGADEPRSASRRWRREQFPVTRSVTVGLMAGRTRSGAAASARRCDRPRCSTSPSTGSGAVEAHSGSFEDNPASAAVSRANGYERNGSEMFDREGRLGADAEVDAHRERWLERRATTSRSTVSTRAGSFWRSRESGR